ncbi:MAG: hypothetical protein L0H63_12610 [Nitrococcus sp.]|nr:hypothetical protein [Nitrococcus sp.]
MSAPALAGSSNADLNLCDARFNKIPLAAELFATKGVIAKSFEPKHTRAWYVVALGKIPQLEKLMDADPSLLIAPNLVLVAATAKQSASLKFFLIHGLDPDMYIKSSEANGPLLMLATNCRRLTSMLYLLNADANIYAYETYDTGRVNAMGVAVMGGGGVGPFIQGVFLLLAAGYDPRCPVAKESTASDILRRTYPALGKPKVENHEINSGKLPHSKHESHFSRTMRRAERAAKMKAKKLASILQGAAKLAEKHSPKPNCGINRTSG